MVMQWLMEISCRDSVSGRRNRRPRRVVGCGREAVTLKLGAVFSTKQAVLGRGLGKNSGAGEGPRGKIQQCALPSELSRFTLKPLFWEGVRREL